MPDIRSAPAAIALRRLASADLEPVHRLLSDWNVVRYMLLPYCATEEQSKKCLDGLLAENPGGLWQSLVRAIVEPGQDVIGLCGIAVQEGSEQGEIWYLVKPEHWGRGVAQAAALQLLGIGFREMNLHRIFATCLPENPASARVLEKIGMRKEGYQVKNLKIHGVWRDCCAYAILREEWLSRGVTVSEGLRVSMSELS